MTQIVIADRMVEVTDALVDKTAAEVSVGEFRSECDGLIEVGNCAVEVAFCLIRFAPHVVGDSEFGIERDGLVEVRNRTVAVALGQEGIAAVEKAKPAAEGIERIGSESVREVHDRPIELRFVLVGAAAVDECFSAVRLDPQRLVKIRNCVVVVALVQIRDAAPEGRGVMSGVDAYDLAIIGDGAIGLTRSDVGFGAIEQGTGAAVRRCGFVFGDPRAGANSCRLILAVLAGLPIRIGGSA